MSAQRPPKIRALGGEWVYGVADRVDYFERLGAERAQDLRVKQHAYAAQCDFGY